MIVDPAWIVAAMNKLEPSAPHRGTYERTASAIAVAAEREPIPGQDPEQTAAIIVGVMWYESRFKQDAKGDCTAPSMVLVGWSRPMVVVPCTTKDAVPHSFCAMQINETNFAGHGTTQREVLTDIDRCVTVGLRILRESFRVCAAAPLPERLRHYAGGGPTCPSGKDPVAKSKHRMNLATRVYSARAASEPRDGVKVPPSP